MTPPERDPMGTESNKMVKVIALFHFNGERPREEQIQYWLNEHAAVIKRCLPEVRRYVQSVPIPVRSRSWAYDAVSELWFDNVASVRRSFEGPLADELRVDEQVFAQPGFEWIIASEVEPGL